MSDVSLQTTANPYVGPRSFPPGRELYGRARETRDLQSLLIAERIVLLHSPSGAGKTSLIQAALIPNLRQRAFFVRPMIRVNTEPALPSANRYLLSALLALEEGQERADQLPPEELAALSLDAYLTRRPAPDDTDGEVLIFDQFEEVLTADPTDEAGRHAFFAQLGAALRNRGRWALFSMREDYVGALEPYVRPVPTRFNTTFRLGLLGLDAARAAIREPARKAGATFADEAITQLTSDLARMVVQRLDGEFENRAGPAIEPVQLQVVCYRLWEGLFGPQGVRHAASERQISTADLAAAGDVGTALGDYYAERVVEAAATSEVRERAIREWFDRELITSHGLRGQVLRGERESQGLPNSAIRLLVDAYLVRSERRRGLVWFELAHDRLIDPVRRANAIWFDAHLSPLQRQADLWQRQGRPDGLLFRDGDLGGAEEWAAANADLLTPAEHDFLAECREARAQAEREREAAARERAQAEEIRRNAERIATDARRIRRLLAIVSAAGAVSLIALVATFFLWRSAEASRSAAEESRQRAEASQRQADESRQRAEASQRQAEMNERVAVARQLASSALNRLGADPELSVLLAASAAQTIQAGDPEVREVDEALQQAVQTSRLQRVIVPAPDQAVNAVAYSPDGAALASVGADGQLRLWDAASGELIRAVAASAQPLQALAFSPDGRVIATGGRERIVSLWNAQNGDLIASSDIYTNTIQSLAFAPSGPPLLAVVGPNPEALLLDAASLALRRSLRQGNRIWSVAFSPDGARVALGGRDGRATIWSVASGQPLGELAHARLLAVAFSPDGTLLATAGQDRVVRVWDLAAEREIVRLRGHTASVYALAFSADGAYLASASSDSTLRLWDFRREQGLLTLAGHGNEVFHLGFAPNGQTLASASADGQLRIWSMRLVHGAPLNAIAYSPDGSLLATIGEDPVVKLWDAASGDLRAVLNGHSGTINSLSFSADGRALVTGGTDGSARLWDVAGQRPAQIFAAAPAGPGQPPSAIRAVALSPDGSLLAAGADDGSVRLWGVADGAEQHVFAAPQRPVNSVAFSADGALLAAGDGGGGVPIWEVATRQPFGEPITYPDWVTRLSFSPQGRRLAIAGFSAEPMIYDLDGGAAPLALRGHGDTVSALDFSALGDQLATLSQDGTIRIWEAASGSELLLLPRSTAFGDIAFHPDGEWVATTSIEEGAARLFALRRERLVALVPARVTRSLSSAECARYNLPECGS